MEKFCTFYAEIKKSMKLLYGTVVLHREIMKVRDFFSQNITLNIWQIDSVFGHNQASLKISLEESKPISTNLLRSLI